MSGNAHREQLSSVVAQDRTRRAEAKRISFGNEAVSGRSRRHCHPRAGFQIIHPERRRDEPRPVSPWRPAAKRGDINYALHAMALQRDGGWTREVHVGFIDGPGFRVRGHQPEKGIGASECALDDIGVGVRPSTTSTRLRTGSGSFEASRTMTRAGAPASSR
jgi:hypothetical protein